MISLSRTRCPFQCSRNVVKPVELCLRKICFLSAVSTIRELRILDSYCSLKELEADDISAQWLTLHIG